MKETKKQVVISRTMLWQENRELMKRIAELESRGVIKRLFRAVSVFFAVLGGLRSPSPTMLPRGR